jgi:4-diphosphocytidyl-2-C-methyl-D-erythritol kinase
MSATRRVRVRALAKINLDLRVLGSRPDGFHELRTIFQTVSLADTLDIAFTPGRKTAIELEDALEIPGNLVTRAARMAMDAMRATGRVTMRLRKRIPMGAGLGGGSSDAAAVLLALPALTGGVMELPELSGVAGELGSDVPFFLLGGTAVGIGRGTELFPLPDAVARPGLLVAPEVHVNTAQAYRDLSPRLEHYPGLTTELQQNKIFSFQSHTWDLNRLGLAANDFEAVVFERHKALGVLKKRLVRAGAVVAMMTGSGSALFGLFADRAGVSRALKSMGEVRAFRISLVSRARYRSMWWRALQEHIKPNIWPPQSRYFS